MEAVRLLHRLGLFPVVFALPAPLDSQLGQGYGAPCCTTVAAASALQAAMGVEVSGSGVALQHARTCWPVQWVLVVVVVLRSVSVRDSESSRRHAAVKLSFCSGTQGGELFGCALCTNILLMCVTG